MNTVIRITPPPPNEFNNHYYFFSGQQQQPRPHPKQQPHHEGARLRKLESTSPSIRYIKIQHNDDRIKLSKSAVCKTPSSSTLIDNEDQIICTFLHDTSSSPPRAEQNKPMEIYNEQPPAKPQRDGQASLGTFSSQHPAGTPLGQRPSSFTQGTPNVTQGQTKRINPPPPPPPPPPPSFNVEFYDPHQPKSKRKKSILEREESLFKALKEYERVHLLKDFFVDLPSIQCKKCGTFFDHRSMNITRGNVLKDCGDCCRPIIEDQIIRCPPGYSFYNDHSMNSTDTVRGKRNPAYSFFNQYNEEDYLYHLNLMNYLSSQPPPPSSPPPPPPPFCGNDTKVLKFRILCSHQDTVDEFINEGEYDIHAKLTPYLSCPGCGVSFESILNYLNHWNLHHIEELENPKFLVPIIKYNNTLIPERRRGSMFPRDIGECVEIFNGIGANFVSWLINKSLSNEILQGYDWGFFVELSQEIDLAHFPPHEKLYQSQSSYSIPCSKTLRRRDEMVVRNLLRSRSRISKKTLTKRTVSIKRRRIRKL